LASLCNEAQYLSLQEKHKMQEMLPRITAAYAAACAQLRLKLAA
jgi:hypothetical protein